MKVIENKKLTFEQEKDLSSIIDFLEENYGVNSLLPYTDNKLNALLKKDKTPNSSQIMEVFGLEYHSEYETNGKGNANYNYSRVNNSNKVTIVNGYDFSFEMSNYDPIDEKDSVELGNKIYAMKSEKKEYGFDLSINNEVIPVKIYDFIKSNSAFENNDNSDELIVHIVQSNNYDLRIIYTSVYGSKKGPDKTIDSYEIKVLVKIKN